MSLEGRDKFASMIGLQQQWRVLETGCGEGGFTVLVCKFIEEGFVVSVDIMRYWAEKAKNMIRSNGLSKKADVIVADSTALPFKEGIFDLATSYRFFSEIRNPKTTSRILREIKRVLKKNHPITIFDNSFMPTNESQRLYMKFWNLWNEFLKLAGEYTWTQELKPKEFVDLLQKCGFKDVQLNFVERPGKIDLQKRKQADEALLEEIRSKVSDANLKTFEMKKERVWKEILEKGIEFPPAVFVKAIKRNKHIP
ncbi:MAG: class I SAM-dependent methyltransferase [Candidatus Bathyarchaeia archaeon]